MSGSDRYYHKEDVPFFLKVNGTGSCPHASPLPSRLWHEPLNESSNSLLVYRLQEMRASANLNFRMALACLFYCGINITLFYINYANSSAHANGEEQPVSDIAFHLIEFWGTFGFAIVECLSLVNTPKSLFHIYNDPLLLKLILFFNIVASSVPALLVSLNLEAFEIVSHEIEYMNELTMSFVDMVLLWSLCSQSDDNGKKPGADETPSSSPKQGGLFFITGIAFFVALVQIGVYNCFGRTDDGDMAGETLAHYFEFFFEILSSLIAFWFCVDNKYIADKEIGLILFGKHDDCAICGAKSDEFQQSFRRHDQTSLVTTSTTTTDGTAYGSV